MLTRTTRKNFSISLMKTDVSTFYIEEFLGLDYGTIYTGDGGEGSAIKVEYQFSTGDTISFD